MKFLDEYRGQTLDELIAMAGTHRTDSLVLAMAEALDDKAEQLGFDNLSEPERVVLVVEAVEREVNNGGYGQLFYNHPDAYLSQIETALRAIGCPRHAALAKRAVAALSVSGEITEQAVMEALDRGGDDLEELLGTLDDEYYEIEEPIADRLFAYVVEHRAQISLQA